MKKIAIPGDEISSIPKRVNGTYIDKGKTYASTITMVDSDTGHLLPLEGAWSPRLNDTVVGVVTMVKNHVYEVDLSHFGRGLIIEGKFDKLSLSVGDIVDARVRDIEDRKTVILENPRKLYGGILVSIKPAKVPRVIGKENTMVKTISSITGSRLAVGYNGTIWISGGDQSAALIAIEVIENEAHTSGLTERVRIMLEKIVKPEFKELQKQREKNERENKTDWE